MDTMKLFGVGLGEIFSSLMLWAPLFGLVALAAGLTTLVWCRGALQKAGRPTTLVTTLIVVALVVVAPIGGCGLGAKYGVERALADIASNGGHSFGRRITASCDPSVRHTLGIDTVDLVVELGPTRGKIKTALQSANVRARLAGVLDLTYLGALEVASYTFLGDHVVWKELRDRAELFLSKPSSKLLEHVLGFLSSAARATLVFFVVTLVLSNGVAWLGVVLWRRRSARDRGLPAGVE